MYVRRVYQTLYRMGDAYGGGGVRVCVCGGGGAQFGDWISIDTDQVIQVRDRKGKQCKCLPPTSLSVLILCFLLLLSLSIFLHLTKTIFFGKSLCFIVPCVSSYRWEHFPRSVLLSLTLLKSFPLRSLSRLLLLLMFYLSISFYHNISLWMSWLLVVL